MIKMKKIIPYGLALILFSNTTFSSIPLERKSQLQKQADIQGNTNKQQTRKIRESIWKLEDLIRYELEIERTGKLPIEKTIPVTRYSPSEKTIQVLDYPSQGIDITIYLKKETNNPSYQISKELEEQIKRGKTEDFPKQGWTTIKRGSKINITPSEKARKFLDKLYENSRAKYLDLK